MRAVLRCHFVEHHRRVIECRYMNSLQPLLTKCLQLLEALKRIESHWLSVLLSSEARSGKLGICGALKERARAPRVSGSERQTWPRAKQSVHHATSQSKHSSIEFHSGRGFDRGY